MRYWGYLCAKLVAAGVMLYGLLFLLNRMIPRGSGAGPGALDKASQLAPLNDGLLQLLCNLALMGWFLLAAGALVMILRDQRYRCRVCLRKLRMPVETGSWGQMLQFGRPRVEYICPYGHGTLRADEVQISGFANPEWTPNTDDYWQELCSSGKDADPRP